MADLNDLFYGTPPTYGVNVVGGGRSPYFDIAKQFGNYLGGLIGRPTPSYQGQIDPGLSPMMSMLGMMNQAYGRSPIPSIMGQAGGVLGRFMNPSFANPMARMGFMGGGFPNYFGGGGMQNPFQPQNPYQIGGGQPMPLPPWLGGQGPGVQPTPPWMQPPGGGPPGQPSISPVGGSRRGGEDVFGSNGPGGVIDDPFRPSTPGIGVGVTPPPQPMPSNPVQAPPPGPSVSPLQPTISPVGPSPGGGIPYGNDMQPRPIPSGPTIQPGIGGGIQNISMPFERRDIASTMPVAPSPMQNLFRQTGGFVPGVSRPGAPRPPRPVTPVDRNPPKNAAMPKTTGPRKPRPKGKPPVRTGY